MIDTTERGHDGGGYGVLTLKDDEAEDFLGALAREFAPTASAEMQADREAMLAKGPRWLPRGRNGAFALARAGFSAAEIEGLFEVDDRWPRRLTPAVMSASAAIEQAIATGSRVACAAAVERWFQRGGYGPGDMIFHLDGLCITGARAGDVDPDTLRGEIVEAAARHGVGLDEFGNLERECREACAQRWCRPTFIAESPTAQSPAAALAEAIFEGWNV